MSHYALKSSFIPTANMITVNTQLTPSNRQGNKKKCRLTT